MNSLNNMFRRLTILFLAITIFLAASRVATAQVTVSDEPKALAVYAPQPAYPSEARDRGITGNGVVIEKIDPRTGVVTSASILKSTGQEILDNAALRAFWHWRFKPRIVTTLEIPIQLTTKGVFY